jgi:hypothetical protein
MTTTFFRTFLCLVFVIAMPIVGFSHPGHGNTDDGNTVSHYLTSPMHLLPMILCAIAIVLLVAAKRSFSVAMGRRAKASQA